MLRWALVTLVGLASAACSDEPEEPSGRGEDASAAACEGRGLSYMPGMTLSGDQVQMELLEATPAPPDLFDNTWSVRVTDAQGAPVTAATVAASAFMPDHGHGSTKTPVIEALADGSYRISPLYLMMPGLWEITIGVPLGEGTDQVTFAFCVEG